MPSFKRVLSLVVIAMAVIFVFTPVMAMAADAPSCTCFCGDKANGAQPTSPAKVADGAACASLCAKMTPSKYYVGCYTNESYFPKENDQCWTKEECNAWAPQAGVVTTKPVWGEQHYSCPKGYGRCYAPQRATKLNVPVLGKTEVFGFGEYLNLAYRFLLGAASVAAVLMVTLAGFKYTTARGNGKEVQAAKDRIRDVIIGLLLLFAAVTIARLIDPRLLDFNVVKVPLTKSATIVPGSLYCEDLQEYGYVIGESGTSNVKTSKVCGDGGEIIGMPEKKNVVSDSLKVGSPCTFRGECLAGQVCASIGGGGYKCLACDNIPSADVSPGACSRVALYLDDADDDENHKYLCEAEMTTGASFDPTGSILTNACVPVNSPGLPYVDCGRVRILAAAYADPCSVYAALNLGQYTTSSVTEAACRTPDICDVSPTGCMIRSGGATAHSGCVTR